MENSSKSLSADEIRKRLTRPSETAITEPPPPVESKTEIDYHSPYLEAAAVLIFYDPATIQPVKSARLKESNGAHNYQLYELIGCSQLVIDTKKSGYTNDSQGVDTSTEDRISYSLKEEVRKKVLTQLLAEGRVAQALATNEKNARNQEDVLQAMFTRCLLQDVPDPTDLNLEQLNALCHVADWLDDLNGMPSREQIRYRIQMMEMLAPFKHLTGKYIDGEFVEQFRGRRDQLSVLRRYAGIVPPQGQFESLERAIRESPIIEKVIDLAKRPPLLIYGLGGIGKSSLLAKFILDHLEAQSQDRFPFVYLDFDRPNLSALEPDTLLIEAARQLAIQYNDHKDFYDAATAFYEKWKMVYNSVIDTRNTEYISIKSDEASQQFLVDRREIQEEFISLIEGFSRLETRPFLMILDTFEEVQYKGAVYVEEMYAFMSRMQQAYPLLRTVIAGRAKVTSFKTEDLELENLDLEAAAAYLLKLGGIDTESAATIAARVGGNPLTLKLAAEVVKEIGMDEFKKTQLSEKKFFFFEKRFSQLKIQGILYKRILGHIHNPNVYKLAYPGLVLRVITPELILQVLNKPCELNISTAAEAKTLFEETSREVSLITRENNLLRHRPDVRKVMLKLIRESKPDTVKEIQEAAIQYYSKLDGKAERAEEIYHRLSLDESPRNLEARWVDGVQNFLMNSIDELPPRAQAYLSARTGIESIDLSIWENADDEDKERYTVRKVADLLNSGLAEKALKLIDDTKDDIKGGLIWLFEVKALSNLGLLQEALDKAKAVLETKSDALKPQIRAELTAYVESLTKSIEYMKQDKVEEEEQASDNIGEPLKPEGMQKAAKGSSGNKASKKRENFDTPDMDNYSL